MLPSALQRSSAGAALPIQRGMLLRCRARCTLTAERDGITADRNDVRAKHEQLQQATGELKQVEAKLNVANAELTRTLRAWAAAEQKIAIVNKRLEETKDGVSQTASIGKTAPPRRPAR